MTRLQDTKQARAAYPRALQSGRREHGPKAGFTLMWNHFASLRT
jgi:hypothetical protein